MATDTMDRAVARAWLARWKEVERVTTEEALALTHEAKFRQLESLMRSAHLFVWPAATEEEDERVREVWMRLHAIERC